MVESGPPLVAYADPDRLRQALDNLVENALRHGAGAVRLGARAADDGVEVHVRDEGDGFAPGFLPRAFDRFARGGGERGPGSGLGLSIVAAVAAAHGGSAHAGERPGRAARTCGSRCPPRTGSLSSPFHEGSPRWAAP